MLHRGRPQSVGPILSIHLIHATVMHILFVVPRIHTNYNGMVKGLVSRGHRVSFLTMDNGAAADFDQSPEVFRLPVWASKTLIRKAPFLNRNPEKFCIPNAIYLAMITRYIRPDIAILRDPSITSSMTQVILRMRGVRTVMYDQHDAHLCGSRAVLYAIGAFLRILPRMRFTTAVDTERHTRFPKLRGYFVRFPVICPQHPKEYCLEESPLKILTIGKLWLARKNLSQLVSSLASLIRDSKVILTIIGSLLDHEDETYQDLVRVIRKERVSHGVSLHENLDYRACLASYKKHDLFILASRREPAAISPLEAMASGIPVICTRQNGTSYAVSHGTSGFLFDVNDFASMRRHVEYFIEHREKLASMGANARQAMLTKFSPDHFARRIEGITKDS